jgi:hypothetical protein
MTNLHPLTGSKSAERLAFEHYLRTGQRLSAEAWSEKFEHKFNPYHDPRDGRFTFAPGGPLSLSHVIISDRRGVHREQQRDSGIGSTVEARASSAPRHSAQVDSISDAVYRPGESSATIQLAQYRPNPRSRIGGNGGPPLNDPMTLNGRSLG